jgi:hypothetical protein
MDTSPCFIFLHGGLCNQLFQIAAAYAHSKRNGYSLVISQTASGGRPTYFKSLLHKFASYVGEPPAAAKFWREPSFSYTPIPAEANILRGFYQSDAYFQDMKTEIMTLFTLPPPLRFAVEYKHAALLTPELRSTAIVVHVRRTDYIGSLKHGILDLPYYERAVAEVRKHNPDGPLFVFSDDLEWCRAQSVFADAIMGPQPKTVIAPSRWFGSTGPADTADLYLDHWHLVDV